MARMNADGDEELHHRLHRWAQIEAVEAVAPKAQAPERFAPFGTPGYYPGMVAQVEEKRSALNALCRTHGVEELCLFGSAAQGAFRSGESDYDFLVRFLPCTPAEHADRYLGLLRDLQDLFSAEVDLLERDAEMNPYFRQQVEATRVSLYAA